MESIIITKMKKGKHAKQKPKNSSMNNLAQNIVGNLKAINKRAALDRWKKIRIIRHFEYLVEV